MSGFELCAKFYPRVPTLAQLVEEAQDGVDYPFTVQDVLVEEISDHDDGYVTGRLSNNTVVHFPGDPSLVGKIVNVYLEESKGFYYMGRPAQ